MRISLRTLIFLFVFLSVQGASASCVTVALLDDAGLVVKPDGLVVGIRVGSAPVFVQQLPPHATQREVGQVSCPPNVIQRVRSLFDLSCRSEQAMMQVAENNSARLDAIRQRCVDLQTALKSALNG
ncbi:MAG: hypothetical protein P8L66_13835 [Rhodospirillaceae bacterium]|nr:hypothetical protein [Rhodospirillaceae bacterium]